MITSQGPWIGNSGGSAVTVLTIPGVNLPAGINVVLEVRVAVRQPAGAVSSITWGAYNLIQQSFVAGANCRSCFWMVPLGDLAVPTSNSVIINLSNSKLVACVMARYGVDQVTPVGSFVTVSGTAGGLSVAVPIDPAYPPSSVLVSGSLAWQDTGPSTATPTGGQTLEYSAATTGVPSGGNVGGAGGRAFPASAPFSESWTISPVASCALVAGYYKPARNRIAFNLPLDLTPSLGAVRTPDMALTRRVEAAESELQLLRQKVQPH